MTHKWKQIEKARELRKLGWTFKEIMKKVPGHRSTLNRWCYDIELTPKQIASKGKRYTARLKGAKSNQIKRQKQIVKIKQEAKKEICPLTDYEFKLAGAALYWAEGSKKGGTSIANSNPELIKFTTKWLKNICNVPNKKFDICLYLHSGHNEEKMKKYWSKITKISLQNFKKSYIKKEGSGHKKIDSYKGTVRLRTNNENLRHKILGWIEGLYIK
ncbi:hypothetical protein KKA23_00805 [Patescibacteria group bacterium]|nr:hypothetical protein [Patescibacteria group bacterium]